jgi:hypothetical protein
MGDASVAMVQVCDVTSEEYKQFEHNAQRFRQTMSPLRFSPEDQDKYMLSNLDNISSTLVNFPDQDRLQKEHGASTRTFHVTHVAKDDTPEGRLKVMKRLRNNVAQINHDYVNVRCADPILTVSGEILTLYKIFGVPKDPLLV